MWAPYLLSGGKVTGARRKIAATGELRAWIAQESATPDWRVDASHAHVGELAETLALLLGDPSGAQPVDVLQLDCGDAGAAAGPDDDDAAWTRCWHWRRRQTCSRTTCWVSSNTTLYWQTMKLDEGASANLKL